MNKLAYTVFTAFWSSMLTLYAVHVIASAEDEKPEADEMLPEITMEELAEHDSKDSCWKAIHGKVYDVTDYIPDHPTSPDVMLEWCGRESTEAWDTKGYGRPHSERAEQMLEEYLVGRLVEDEEANTPDH